ncbi:acyltransferase [Pseudoflavitalea sp. X16]|uniref:acyltransferase family protein n=1 Tax=Paraflavitalea devenefica TaxID=2716334 RepID=UPI00141ED511|nr:acyltransferase [Paraflavitalea devenefica]NII24551.1 acyltransferase [Paraflavitalea devenefica]
MKYIKQLDSLRAIAVLLVIVSHWLPASNIINRFTPNGAIGVTIFFVLSGFLISKILFDNKNHVNYGISKGTILKNFYVRRSLRIFPIYYLTIFILLAFNTATDTHIKSAFIFYATYASNFYFLHTDAWDGMLSHLWSLAVEEQFYLLWPWIILFINKKYLPHVIGGFILTGLISSFLLRGIRLGYVLPFTCFDAFGLGALLAWQVSYGLVSLKRFYQILSLCAGVSTILFLWHLASNKTIYFPERTIISIISLWLITYIVINADSNKPLFKFVWDNRILIFLGKISYGLYLYHNLIPTLNSKVINVYINPLLPDILFKRYWGELFLAENTILLIFISWLSFVFIEKKFLFLKKYFEYKETKNTAEANSTISLSLVSQSAPDSTKD